MILQRGHAVCCSFYLCTVRYDILQRGHDTTEGTLCMLFIVFTHSEV